MHSLVPSCSLVLSLAMASASFAGEEITTSSGLKYEVITAGPADGVKPRMFSLVKVHYTGTLADGTKFDSSHDRGQPAEFRLGQVIEGWNEGLQLMTVGSRFKFTVPPALGYGAGGAPPVIPPDATLNFDVELLEVTPAPALPAFARCDAASAKKTESGIVYEVVTASTGKQVTSTDTLSFHLSYWSVNGRELGSTLIENNLQIGKPSVMRLKFLQEALPLMQEGSSYRFEAPASLTFTASQLPAGVGADEPTIWLLEVQRIIDMNLPEFVMPKDEELTKLASGLQYQVVREGSGEPPKMTQSVLVNYAGWLTDGKKFDASYDRNQPAQFGVTQVIPGWTEGLQLMKPGAIYRFVIPPTIAYGEEGSPPLIPGNSTLVFHVELLSIR
jgi:FKBP-type peptidyl-prolyl cis-trans isomerase